MKSRSSSSTTRENEYKTLSLTYKILSTSQLADLYNLISLQSPRCTRSSSLVTLARPPSHSTLKITDRSFRYASPHIWNQLSGSFRQPRRHLSLPDSSLLHIIISAHLRRHHCHHPSHLLLSVPTSKHSFFTNLFPHRPPAPSGLL